jgi:hypothetical protein
VTTATIASRLRKSFAVWATEISDRSDYSPILRPEEANPSNPGHFYLGLLGVAWISFAALIGGGNIDPLRRYGIARLPVAQLLLYL